MKKMIFRTGFLLLTAVLYSFSSYAYVFGYEEDYYDPSVGIPVNVQVTSSGLTDVDFSTTGRGYFFLAVDVEEPGGSFSLNLMPGEYWVRDSNSWEEHHFIISPLSQRVEIGVGNGGVQYLCVY
jgi:hypothetical protein